MFALLVCLHCWCVCNTSEFALLVCLHCWCVCTAGVYMQYTAYCVCNADYFCQHAQQAICHFVTTVCYMKWRAQAYASAYAV